MRVISGRRSYASALTSTHHSITRMTGKNYGRIKSEVKSVKDNTNYETTR
jgi:hypothetical protein